MYTLSPISLESPTNFTSCLILFVVNINQYSLQILVLIFKSMRPSLSSTYTLSIHSFSTLAISPFPLTLTFIHYKVVTNIVCKDFP